jgi:hypothetical protein
LNRIEHQLKAALTDLLAQLEGIGIYIAGEDAGQWSGTEGLSFSKAAAALAEAKPGKDAEDDAADIHTSSIWSYRKHPERKYVVAGVANIAHKHRDHPPMVVYRSLAHPGRLWTRSIPSFRDEFVPTGEMFEAAGKWKAGDGDWNDSRDVYSAGIDIGKWSNQIECHGEDQQRAEQLRDHVLMTAQMAARCLTIQGAMWDFNGHPVHVLTLPDGTQCDVFPDEHAGENDIDDQQRFLLRLSSELAARRTATESPMARLVKLAPEG